MRDDIHRFCQHARARVGWCVGSPRDRDGSGRRRPGGASTRSSGSCIPLHDCRK
ncbi:hypothetical protein [Ornithinimicrobium kibberense]|uniref:hypothetical protein n=1 Tax=Ornithinimicrobium kibberense TaxID=282060 RepID=UPI0036119181